MEQVESVHDIRVWNFAHNTYVVHYADIPYRSRKNNESYPSYQNSHIAHAIKKLDGELYNTPHFGGGIIFQAPEGYRKRIEKALS